METEGAGCVPHPRVPISQSRGDLPPRTRRSRSAIGISITDRCLTLAPVRTCARVSFLFGWTRPSLAVETVSDPCP